MAGPEDYESFVIRGGIKKFNRPVGRSTHRAPPMPAGFGYLAGSFPDGITLVEGVPASADVLVRLRQPGNRFDGYTLATTRSAPDGTWLVGGLDHTLKYDVVCRHEGYNDMILSNVSPVVD